MSEPEPRRLADESRWYTEHTPLLISTLKWAVLGTLAGFAVGLGTKAFLWALAASGDLIATIRMGPLPYYALLPLALPVCLWLIRTFAPTAKGHGTAEVIAASMRARRSVSPTPPDWTCSSRSRSVS